MADAVLYAEQSPVRLTAQAAASVGELRQLADGRAGFLNRQTGAAIGDAQVPYQTTGQVTVTKTAGIVILDGGRVYWDYSAAACTFRTVNDRDFYAGVAVGDAASIDTTMTVNLNVEPVYEADLHGSPSRSQCNWTPAATNGLGVTPLLCGGAQLYFDAVVEAAMAAFYSDRTFSVDANLIVEIKAAIFDIGDNAALDINLGVAKATHATDFDSVTERVSFHWDGSSLTIKAGSTDGTTTVAYTTTTIDAVDDTYVELWIDMRNKADIQLYVNAVNVLPASVFSLELAASALFPIAHMEKTSDDTSADVRIEFFRARTAKQ